MKVGLMGASSKKEKFEREFISLGPVRNDGVNDRLKWFASKQDFAVS
jgi:hypothetical protein